MGSITRCGFDIMVAGLPRCLEWVTVDRKVLMVRFIHEQPDKQPWRFYDHQSTVSTRIVLSSNLNGYDFASHTFPRISKPTAPAH